VIPVQAPQHVELRSLHVHLQEQPWGVLRGPGGQDRPERVGQPAASDLELDALRHLSVGPARLRAVPGEGRLPSKCSVAWDADPQQAASCNADPGFWKASFYYGHFSPLRLGRVSNGHCFLMLRNPVGRAMSHFRSKRLAETMFGGKSFESLDTSQIQAAVAATGGGLYASKFLGCGGKDCEDKKARTVLTVAREQLSRCHVGITEKPRETMSYLMMLLPWFQGSFTIMDEGGSQVEDRLIMAQFSREMKSKLYGMFQGDHFLYEDGQKFFQKQLLGSVTCYTQEKYMGDESALARDIRKIARRVTRRSRQDRDQMSICLERRKLCLAPEVDQRSCSCSEFVDFRED